MKKRKISLKLLNSLERAAGITPITDKHHLRECGWEECKVYVKWLCSRSSIARQIIEAHNKKR